VHGFAEDVVPARAGVGREGADAVADHPRWSACPAPPKIYTIFEGTSEIQRVVISSGLQIR
jgi:hypothetical protein